jgi:hypothetical protein
MATTASGSRRLVESVILIVRSGSQMSAAGPATIGPAARALVRGGGDAEEAVRRDEGDRVGVRGAGSGRLDPTDMDHPRILRELGSAAGPATIRPWS